ncbi:MAG: FadR family transcriptional regulator [Clostridia bacterium]|nr:FadR family transcriptional regulator [Clostridia bacterium]
MARQTSFFSSAIPENKEDFLAVLEERIIRGKLPVGFKLPTERQFEAETGMGKSAVHGALVELEHRGFVNISPRKGVYVADYAKNGNSDTLNAVLRCNGGRLSFKMSVELVELRNAIEGGALMRLAESHTDEDLKKLNDVLDELRGADAAGLEIPGIAEIERRFHMLICELSGNDMFSLVMRSFSNVSVLLWQYCALFWGVDGFIDHDQTLIGLIERGEGDKACRYLRDFYEHFLTAFYENQE